MKSVGRVKDNTKKANGNIARREQADAVRKKRSKVNGADGRVKKKMKRPSKKKRESAKKGTQKNREAKTKRKKRKTSNERKRTGRNEEKSDGVVRSADSSALEPYANMLMRPAQLRSGRVTMWNLKTKRKMIKRAPAPEDVSTWLFRRPEFVIYRGQDKPGYLQRFRYREPRSSPLLSPAGAVP